jgi:hypothetical protein
MERNATSGVGSAGRIGWETGWSGKWTAMKSKELRLREVIVAVSVARTRPLKSKVGSVGEFRRCWICDLTVLIVMSGERVSVKLENFTGRNETQAILESGEVNMPSDRCGFKTRSSSPSFQLTEGVKRKNVDQLHTSFIDVISTLNTRAQPGSHTRRPENSDLVKALRIVRIRVGRLRFSERGRTEIATDRTMDEPFCTI